MTFFDWLVWIGGTVAALVVAAALVEAYLKRNKNRRLSDMRPDPDSLRRRPWEADGVANVRSVDKSYATSKSKTNETGRFAFETPDVNEARSNGQDQGNAK